MAKWNSFIWSWNSFSTYDYLQKLFVVKIGTRGDYTASEDDNVLVQGVSGDKYFRFLGLTYEYNKDKLSLVPVDIRNGPTSSLETVNNGTYSPLQDQFHLY